MTVGDEIRRIGLSATFIAASGYTLYNIYKINKKYLTDELNFMTTLVTIIYIGVVTTGGVAMIND